MIFIKKSNLIMRKQLIRFLPLFFVLFFLSCEKDKNGDNEDLNREIYSLFQDIYLWYDQLPKVDPGNYSSPSELVQALRYHPLDRWSFVMTEDEYISYFIQGEMIGHGFILSSDEQNNVRIALIYPSTQAYEKGVRRGWILNKVNGTNVTDENVIELLGKSEIGINNRINFTNNEGASVEISLTKEIIEIDPVVYSNVIDYNGRKIGYFVFQDFIDVANKEIDSIFNVFRQENIDGLIMDMRYNGGGSVDVAVHISGWLTGNENANKNLINFEHNNKNRDYDTLYNIPVNAGSLDLDNIVFIGTSGTASASELIINGMEPYMDVTLVGTPTEGKPVGMYAVTLRNFDYTIFPISFKYTNARGEGDFYEGLQPDVLVNDDITHDFGDTNEAMLNSALNKISGGGVTTKKSTTGNKIIEPETNISDFQKAF